MKQIMVLIGALAATGCIETITENRVESALKEAGLSERNSQCMATRMVDRLTISQLRKLEQLKAKKGEPAKPTNLAGYVERVRRVGDTEVITVTATSAVACSVGLG